jgi:hypothetical protein
MSGPLERAGHKKREKKRRKKIFWSRSAGPKRSGLDPACAGERPVNGPVVVVCQTGDNSTKRPLDANLRYCYGCGKPTLTPQASYADTPNNVRLTMNQKEIQTGITVYDSGPLPLLIRVPCLALGLFCFLLACDLVSHRAFGVGIIFATPPETPSGFIPALLAAIVLSWFMFLAFFGRNRIFWIPSSQELVLKYRGLFFCKTSKHIHRDTISFVAIRRGRLLASTFWDLYVMDPKGKRRWLTRSYDEDKAKFVARTIAQAVGVIYKPL